MSDCTCPVDGCTGPDSERHWEPLITMGTVLPAPTDEELVHVGWWCWRGGPPGHLATQACKSDNVPIHVPAEWADDMRRVIQQIEDGEYDE